MKITDQMITAAVSAMAKADITFANCDAGWQKNAMRAALSSALHPHQEGEKEGSTPAPQTQTVGQTNALGICDGCLVEFRNGETHGPVKHVEGDRFPWQYKKDDHTYKWTEDGKSIVGSQYDIVRVNTPPQHHAVALAKINDIRNSIIGFQTINWSEHIYPLVAALEEAGIEGAEYPAARANVGTMLDRTLAAKDAVEALQGLINEALSVLDGYADPTAYTDNQGEMLPPEAEVHDGILARDTAAKIRAALAATSEGQP